MSVAVTVSDVQERVRQRMSLPAYSSTTFVTTSEILDLVKQSAQLLSAIIDEAWGGHYFTTSLDMTLIAGTPSYDLPTNFADLIRIAWMKTAGEPFIMLKPASVDDWEPNPTGWSGGVVPRYRVIGPDIHFYPTPMEAHQLRMHYSTGIFINAASDVINARVGWDEWLVLDVCAKIQTKLEMDPSVYIAQRERVERMIKQQCSRRDKSRPGQIRDLRGADERNWLKSRWPWRS